VETSHVGERVRESVVHGGWVHLASRSGEINKSGIRTMPEVAAVVQRPMAHVCESTISLELVMRRPGEVDDVHRPVWATRADHLSLLGLRPPRQFWANLSRGCGMLRRARDSVPASTIRPRSSALSHVLEGSGAPW
jgi:hypothetical protein